MDGSIAGMVWWHYPVALFAGALLVNGIPHFVQGVCGHQFATPFSGGPGTLDTAIRNVLWGSANFLVGVLLLWWVSASLALPALWVVAAIGGLASGLFLAYAFSHPPEEPRRRRR